MPTATAPTPTLHRTREHSADALTFAAFAEHLDSYYIATENLGPDTLNHVVCDDVVAEVTDGETVLDVVRKAYEHLPICPVLAAKIARDGF